jgi:DNA-binding NtrC family response regulator
LEHGWHNVEKNNNMTTLNQKVFVVDDDRFHLELMEQLLSNQGIQDVMLFESGMDCLMQIHQEPSIVFLDHQMDVYSGYETLRKIKRHNPNIFVVMVSGQGDIQTAVDTLKHGAIDYLQKDRNLEMNILSVIHRIEAVKKMLRERKPSILKSFLSLV